MMKKFAIALLALAFAAPAVTAQVSVRGYVRSDGTYVAPHYRSAPNNTTSDNYSTQGNVNPYTGAQGTKSPYGGSFGSSFGSSYGSRSSSSSSSYGSSYSDED